jgi:thiazole tautomerase (transcriptional regulator TenI)
VTGRPVVPVLHVITDDDVLRSPDFLTRAADVLAALGPRGALHIRGHRTSARRLYDIATTVAPLASLAGAMLVVNDRVDVALAVGVTVEAVQIGERSFSVDEVRRIGPHLRVGVSVHSIDEVASASGADWIIAGHIFDTPSHASEPSRGLDFLRQVCQVSPVPVIAIGGIEPRDVGAIREAGAYGVAVIRGVWDAPAGAVHEAVDAYLGELDR